MLSRRSRRWNLQTQILRCRMQMSGSSFHQFAFRTRQLPPLTGRQFRQPEMPNPHAQQTQCRMADGRRHFTNLTVLALDQFQTDPAIRNALAKTDGRIARRNDAVSALCADCFETTGSTLQFPAAAPATTHGTATSSGPESKFLFPVSANFPATEFFRSAPNTRARARGAGAAVFRSTPVRRSRAKGLPNLRRAVRWDKHFLVNQIQPVRD